MCQFERYLSFNLNNGISIRDKKFNQLCLSSVLRFISSKADFELMPNLPVAIVCVQDY